MLLIVVAALAFIAIAISKRRIDAVEQHNPYTWLIVAMTFGAIVAVAALATK